MRHLLLTFVGLLLMLTSQAHADQHAGDYGDAPDSTNSSGVTMTTYPTAVTARFPTTVDAVSANSGPLHLNPAHFHLGPRYSREEGADSGFDPDGPNNINPPANAANRDRFDDGVRLPEVAPDNCQMTRIVYLVDVSPAAAGRDAVFNMWFDWDRSGHWGGEIDCRDGPAEEWAVVNQVITLPAVAGLHVFVTPPFRSYYHAPEGEPLWIRATLSEEEADPQVAFDGSGPAGGYQFGETEDYLYRPEMPGIHGVKYHDLNGNGQRDPGEPGLPGWTIVLDPGSNQQQTQVTDEQGRYWFVDVTEGPHRLGEQQQQGWVQTAPPGGFYSIDYDGVSVLTGYDFGNWQGDPEGDCDLVVRKWHEGDAFTYGEQGIYHVDVRNVGDGLCEGPIRLTDTLPEGMSVPPGAFNVGGWSCMADNNDPQTITCEHPGPLPPGGVLPQITLTVSVPGSGGGAGWDGDLAVNCAAVFAPNEPQANTDDNESCDQVPVITPERPDACHTTWDVHLPPFLNYVDFYVTIFNNSTMARTYTLNIFDGPGLSGMGSFTTTPAMPVAVPAGSAVNVLVTVAPQPVVSTIPVAPYTVVVTDLAGNTLTCNGVVWDPASDDWWTNAAGEPLLLRAEDEGRRQVPNQGLITFEIHNFSDQENVMDVRIEPMSEGDSAIISLNGGQPGEAVLFPDVVVGAFDTIMLPVSVSFTAPGIGDVIMYVDEDQDGADDAASSMTVYTPQQLAPTLYLPVIRR
ncbi:MAG: SdrD B-like domain-containing protein [Candidatus Promineifilaceae bacterium]|nr:SdrD B-like domain-containing protein [Candidatus Promineifilaceae bacterium]